MSVLHLLMLALVQGLTEFLPVSSSGHLILFPAASGLQDQGQFIDVAVHLGTLGAVIIHLRSDVQRAFRGIGHLVSGRRASAEARLVLALAAATVPVVVAGLFLAATGLSDRMRSIEVVAWTTIVFAGVLYWCDRTGRQAKSADSWSPRDAWILGLWQVLALVPGTSRSGITMSGARRLGYGREDSARIAFLMSIPVIMASAVLLGSGTVGTVDAAAMRNGAIAAGLAFLAALTALAVLTRLLRRISFTPFVLYRIGLGTILLWIVYG
ncbi:MAG: undecaprenyl-diphosphate phosphatase [Paracoccaceae bacterium]|nr:undecaprenyl-diphosphate phosphatase [Paracoccaceae bacterium]